MYVLSVVYGGGGESERESLEGGLLYEIQVLHMYSREIGASTAALALIFAPHTATYYLLSFYN